MKATYTFYIIYLLSIQIAYSQVFEVGDFINDLVGTVCENGDGDWKLPYMSYAKNAELVIGITCRKDSGVSNAIMEVRHQCDTLLIAPLHHDVLDTLVIPAKTYHKFECTALWTIYRIMEHIGVILPELSHIK